MCDQEVKSGQMICRWCYMFNKGRQSEEDESRSKRQFTSTIEINIAGCSTIPCTARRRVLLSGPTGNSD
ncbi:hypothetical protein TNCV_5136181 [Trichonephila clavipes]|nr:hypothetical protein TNCV_5136181 [Trichonephila clavipes]